MKNIAVVGVGSLGKRHIQALTRLSEENRIYGVDINLNNIRDQLVAYNCVEFLSDVCELPRELEVVIIATTSGVRRDVFDKIVRQCSVKNIIFEKFLFNKIQDYYDVQADLVKYGIRAWVNCPRRAYTAYNNLKKLLATEKIQSISVSGGGWGLASNAVHFMDLIQYFTNDQTCEIDSFCIKSPIIESKRKGYIDFCGYINGKCGDTHYTIDCFSCSKALLQITIETDQSRVYISEQKEKVIKIDSECLDCTINEEPFLIPKISELTDQLVYKIINKGECNLPEYNLSMKTHIEFLNSVQGFLKTMGKGNEACLIT